MGIIVTTGSSLWMKAWCKEFAQDSFSSMCWRTRKNIFHVKAATTKLLDVRNQCQKILLIKQSHLEDDVGARDVPR